MEMINVQVGDVVVLKKPHACGFNSWEITRVGVDIKLKCLNCHHEVMIERVAFNKKFKKKDGNVNA